MLLKSIYFFSDWLWPYCDVVFTWVSHGWYCFFLFHWFAITFGIRFFFPAWWLFFLLYVIYSQNEIGKQFICLYLGGKGLLYSELSMKLPKFFLHHCCSINFQTWSPWRQDFCSMTFRFQSNRHMHCGGVRGQNYLMCRTWIMKIQFIFAVETFQSILKNMTDTG